MQLHGGAGRLQLGAVARLPAGAADLIAQPNLPRFFGGQRHRHDADLAVAQAFFFSQQGLEFVLQAFFFAGQLQRAREVAVRAFVQGLRRGDDGAGRDRRAGCGGCARCAAGMGRGQRRTGHGPQVVRTQFQRLFFRIQIGHPGFQIANALLQRADASGRLLARQRPHADFAHAHGIRA